MPRSALALLVALAIPVMVALQAPASLEMLPSPAATGSAEPNLTAGPDGKVYLSWIEPVAAGGHAVRFAAHDGARWTPARTIAQGTDFFVNWADFPSLHVLANGHLAAHWLQRTGRPTYAYGVRIARSTDGGATWSAPVAPHRDTSLTEHGFVALWSEGSQLSAVWLDGRKTAGAAPGSHSGEMSLYTTTLAANGTLGREVELDGRVCDCCQTAAAMTSEGPVLVYRDRTHDEVRDIYTVRRTGTGAGARWSTGTPVHRDNWTIAACPVNGPAIAASGRNVAVAWFTAPGDQGQVKLAFSSDAGATFGPPVRIDGGMPAGRVDVGLLGDGSALVTWVERTGGDTAAVRARRVTRQGQASTPITITSSTAARASGFPHLALTRTHAVFAWTVPGRPSAVQVARLPLTAIR
jgi:hypothetical protein